MFKIAKSQIKTIESVANNHTQLDWKLSTNASLKDVREFRNAKLKLMAVEKTEWIFVGELSDLDQLALKVTSQFF